jgi:hypothetical protein
MEPRAASSACVSVSDNMMEGEEPMSRGWNGVSPPIEHENGLWELLGEWPLPRPEDWAAWVNQAQSEAELKALRRSVVRGCPYGEAGWVKEAVAKLGLEITLRPRGRPKKTPAKQAKKGS